MSSISARSCATPSAACAWHTATDAEIDRALSGVYVDIRGNRFVVRHLMRMLAGSLEPAIRALENNQPLIVLTSHHAMMLTRLTWLARSTPDGIRRTLRRAIVRDPWPYPAAVQRWKIGPGKRFMNTQEFHDIRRVIFVLRHEHLALHQTLSALNTSLRPKAS